MHGLLSDTGQPWKCAEPILFYSDGSVIQSPPPPAPCTTFSSERRSLSLFLTGKLPAEIREMVYAEFFAASLQKHPKYTRCRILALSLTRRMERRASLDLLLVSKQIYQEAKPIYVSEQIKKNPNCFQGEKYGFDRFHKLYRFCWGFKVETEVTVNVWIRGEGALVKKQARAEYVETMRVLNSAGALHEFVQPFISSAPSARRRSEAKFVPRLTGGWKKLGQRDGKGRLLQGQFDVEQKMLKRGIRALLVTGALLLPR